MANLNLGQYVYCNCLLTGFDLTTLDSYFMILVEVFMNHILAENTFHEPYRVKRTQDSYRRFPPLSISLSSKSFVNNFSYGAEIANHKDETINHSNIYFLLDLFWWEKHFVKLCNARKFNLFCSVERIILRNCYNVQKQNKLIAEFGEFGKIIFFAK